MTDEIIIGGDSVDIPAGTYPAKVSTITTKTSDAFGEFRAWDFQLDSGALVGGATSMNTGSKSKGGRWIAALLGRKPNKDEKVKLAGLPCLVVVAEDDKGWPKVTDVLPPMAGFQATDAILTEDKVTAPVRIERIPGQEDLPF